jgi:glutamate-1-semialdehyde 2,1-aminomutase
VTDQPRPCQSKSAEIARRLELLVPGGAHTYAKGPDQYPADLAPIIGYGRGARVWDVDGNEYVEYGSGLRSVVLGHVHPAVTAAVRAQIERGTNFARPSSIELQAAERFLACVPGAEMVKFAKNGSDATTAAVKLARAVTGRALIAVCQDHPFFSTDDWFISTTPMDAGIPRVVRDLTVSFPYGDLGALDAVLAEHDGEVAAVILEPRTLAEPPPGYLEAVRDLVHSRGALLIFDEMITGFRLSESGAQGVYGVTPDLSTFGKALGNGFAVSALCGRQDYMQRGGLTGDENRVFLLSTTHGAETHALAAAIAVMDVFAREGVAATLREQGERLLDEVGKALASHGVADHIVLRGHPSNLVFATLDDSGQPSQAFRTLFLRQLLLGGVLAPSFVVSAALRRQDLDITVEAVDRAAAVYSKALDNADPGPWMGGRSVKPVFRRYP